MFALYPFYQADPEQFTLILRAEIERCYGPDTSLLRKMTAGYFLSIMSYVDAERENFDLQTMLKDVRALVNKTIPY